MNSASPPVAAPPPPVVPSCLLPSSLTTLAARAAARCLIYEDYEDCFHYRWDPVNIWQYEIPQKKKKGKKATERSQAFSLNESAIPPPQPAWQEIKKFRDWWWQTNALGSMDSVLRGRIIRAFEQLSWTATSEEEFILFLILRICIETKIELGNTPFEIQSEWCADLAQILTQLGPFPLLKLYVTHEHLSLKPLLISLVQQSPQLQVLHMNQWALSNDLMASLGSRCRMLTEFAIPHMQPQVFMSDEALFECFFEGMSGKQVLQCCHDGTRPSLSFWRLKLVDILYWKQTERFIQMLALFYPSVRLRNVDAHFFEEVPNGLTQPFLDVGAKVTAMTATCRLADILQDRLSELVRHAPYLRELRIHIDSGLDNTTPYPKAKLEEAGSKLKKVTSELAAFESLAIRHSFLGNVTPAFRPALFAQGESIMSLHICSHTPQLESNAIYQLVNLCPKLCCLMLCLPLGEEDVSTGGFRTVLHPCHTLHTLTIQNSCATVPDDPQPFRVPHRLLEAAPNLKMLCKVWGVGMLSIVALTTSNIILTLRLMHGGEDSGASCGEGGGGVGGGGGVALPQSIPRSWTSALSSYNHSEYLAFLRSASIDTSASKPPQSTPSLVVGVGGFKIDTSKGRWDDRRNYKTYDHVFTGPRYASLTKENPVCLATQTSVDRLFWLAQVAKYWTTPMSVAVFTPDIEYGIARAYLSYLVTCFPFLGEKSTFHFTYPKGHPPKDLAIVIDKLDERCDQPVGVLKELLKKRDSKMMSWRERMIYPQNVVRNVARKNCDTEWVFLVDVDIVPIPELSRDLSVFLASKAARTCKKCAFVVPTYEVDERASLPRNRSSLMGLAARGRAMPFHHKVFLHNQHATNFSRWEAREREHPGEREVSISHAVNNFEFFYEPFYVARDDVPPHDERFLGYGFTRNTQVYEMHVSGYTFHVLSPIFTLHWGMQVKRSRPAWREKQNNINRRLFEGFKREVFARYGKDPLNMMGPRKPSAQHPPPRAPQRKA